MCRLATLTALLVLSLALLVPTTAAAPSLAVLSPSDGAVIRGTSVTVTFTTADVTLARTIVPLAQAGARPEVNRPNEGHIHLMLDLQPLVVWERSDPYTFTNVTPGEHQLTVELVHHDHSPLAAPIVQRIRFRTEGAQFVPGTGAGPLLQRGVAGAALSLAGLVLAAGGLILRHTRRQTA